MAEKRSARLADRAASDGVSLAGVDTQKYANPPHKTQARLPHGFTCTFSYGDDGLQTEWEPHLPTTIRSLRARRKFHAAYQRARDDFLKDVATMKGGNVGVIEIGTEAIGLHVVFPETKH